MAIITTDAPCIYLTVTNEDIAQVCHYLDAMKTCALENTTKDVNKIGYPPTTTFRFPLPGCMAIEVEGSKEG